MATKMPAARVTPSLRKILGNQTDTLPSSPISSKGPMDNYSWKFTNEMALPDPTILTEAHGGHAPHMCDELPVKWLQKKTTVFHFKPHFAF